MIGRTRCRTQGVTLIELMVGLTVSMIVVLAMLQVFKTTMHTTVSAGQGASTDRQRLSGLFASQKILLGAGFGIDNPSFGNDLVVLSDATLANEVTGTPVSTLPASGNAIIWGDKSTGAYACTGLYAPAAGGLYRLKTTSCTSAKDAQTLAWDYSVLIDDSHAVQISVSKASDANGCRSFGITGAGGLWVKLTTTNSTEASSETSTSACLINFPTS